MKNFTQTAVHVMAMLGMMLPAMQAQVTSTLTHTFPFGACFTTKADGNTIFMGTGSGIYVLDGSSDEPTFVTSPSGVKSRLHAGGLVREIDVSEDFVYVAATRKGLVRFDRPTMNVEAEAFDTLSEEDAEAWAVTQQHIGTQDVVLVGSNIDYIDGTIELYWSDATSGLQFKASRSVNGPVYALESKIDQYNEKLIVLVGTGCAGGTENPGAVQEFDFDISSGDPPSAIPSAPTATWSVMEGSSPVLTLIQDIVISPTSNVAFVAAHTRGVHRLLLGDLFETIGYGWPIECDACDCRYQGLSLIQPTTSNAVLAVAQGYGFDDGQEWGTCSMLTGCDESESDEGGDEELAVKLYNATGTAILLSVTGERPMVGAPYKVSTRTLDDDHFRIDVAAGQHGLRVIKATRNGSSWVIEEDGEVDQSDGLPLANINDVATLYDSVVVSAESGIAAFDASISTSSSLLLDEPDAYVNTGAVFVSTMEAGTGPGSTGTFPAMIFSGRIGDVLFVRPTLDNGVVVSVTGTGSLETNGKPYGTKAFPAGTTPDDYPWLFVANKNDDVANAACDPRESVGAIRIYRLGKTVHGEINPSLAVQIGAWIPSCGNSAFDGKRGQLLDLWVEPDGETDFTIWATYGNMSTSDPGFGVIAVNAHWNGPSPPHGTPPVTCSFLGKEQVGNASSGDPGRIHYRPDTGTLFAGFGCQGVAKFSASPGEAPELLRTFSLGGESALGVVHGPSGDSNMYAAFLNGSIEALDTTANPMTKLATITTPYQPQALILAPSDTSGPAFYVADGSGGLHRIQLSGTP